MLRGMAPLPPAPLTLPDGRPLHDIPENHRDSSGLALPPVFSFAAVVGGASKTYWHDRFDEALRHSRENALAMRRDAYLMSLLQERKFAVSSLPWYLEVPDPKDKRQAKVRATLTQCLRGTRGLRRMLLAWLEAIWYGRYGVQFSWRWQQVEGRRALAVKDWAPVNGDKIGYHWDGTPYVLVNAARAGDLTGAVLVNTTRARALSLQGGWRQRFVIHQHEIDDADYFEAEAAGGRHGVGIRSRIYWLDFLKREYLDWVVTYLERVGLGTTFWKYDAGNPKAKEAAEQAALDNSRRVNIVVPVWPDSRGGFSGGVERVEAPMGGVESLRTMIEAMDAYIERYVVGQAGSSRSQSSGLGNEAASEFMASTKDAIRDHDAHLLAETITGDESHPGLISLFQQYTFPEFTPGTPNGFPVLFKFGLEKSLNNQRVQSIQQIVQLGLPVRKDDIYNAAGLSRPEEQDDVLEPQQQGMGGPGGEGGGNPLAALMGGGGAPGAPAEGGTPEEGGDVPASEQDIDAFLNELLGGGGGDEPEGDTASEDEVDDFLSELLGGGEDDDQPQQMARQGRGVEQYGWKEAEGYVGKTKKWIGTDEDEGKKPRYQQSKPGGGRSKSDGGKPTSKKKGKADPERARVALTRLKKEGDSAEIRDELRQALDGLTVPQLDELRREFGIRGGGKRKAEKQESIAGHKPGDVSAKKPSPAVAPKAKKAPLVKPLRPSEKALEAIQRIEDKDAFNAAVAGMSDSELLEVLIESMNGADINLLRKLSRKSMELLISEQRGAEKRKAEDEATHSKILDVIKEDKQSADLAKKVAGLGTRIADPKKVAGEHKKKVAEALNILRKAVGSKDIAAARAKYDKLKSGGNAASLAAVRKTRDAARAALVEAIKDKTPGKIDITYEKDSPKIRAGVTKAVEWLSAIAGAADVKVVIKVGPPGTRAVANTKGGVNYVTVAPDGTDLDAAVVHEICHHIERQPGIQRALQQYLGHRCKGERPQRLNEVGLRGYSNSEKGRKDDFAKVFGEKDAWYVGKAYGNGQSELLSMSVQKLYEDPVAMAEGDPELTQFIIGVLQGRIKGNA